MRGQEPPIRLVCNCENPSTENSDAAPAPALLTARARSRGFEPGDPVYAYSLSVLRPGIVQ